MAEAPVETDADPLEPRPIVAEDVEDTRRPAPFLTLPNDFHFYQLLLEIGNEISKDTLDNIKFLYQGDLKSKLNEKIQDAKELFNVLKQRQYITPENLIHLQKIVMMVDDLDTQQHLMERIYEFSTKHKAIHFRPCTDEPANGYRRIKFHIKGLEHYLFDRKYVKNLMAAVATLTGMDIGEVLPDGIQLTNSIYISLLIPNHHYGLFMALLKGGLPLLSELGVDMVTFDDGTTIAASSGVKIVDELPPIEESPDEIIQRLRESIETLQIENIDYSRKIEALDRQVKVNHGEVSGDLKEIATQFEEAMNEVIEKDMNNRLFQRTVSLNSQLVRGLERKRMEAIHNQLKSELEQSKLELMDFKLTAKIFEASMSTEVNADLKKIFDDGEATIPSNKAKGTDVNNEGGHAGEKTTNATDVETRIRQFLLENFKASLQRTYDLGYPKSVIRQLVSNTTMHVQHSQKEISRHQLNRLTEECRLLQEELANKEALLQLTLPDFLFKEELMQQIEAIFESQGKTIPLDKGYKEDVVKLTMDISRRISHEEGSKLEMDYTDVPLTAKVKRDRSFLLLRLYYLENLKSDGLVLIENFVSKKLTCIERSDLDQTWRARVVPGNQWQQDLETIIQMMLGGMSQANHISPEFTDLLRKINSKISEKEKAILKRNFLSTDSCVDEEILERILQNHLAKITSQTVQFMDFMREVFRTIDRDDLFLEFQRESLLRQAFHPEIGEILRKTSLMISKTQKKKLKSNLTNQTKCKDLDDILGCMAMEHFKGNPITIDQLADYLKTKLVEQLGRKDVYEEFEKQMSEKNLLSRQPQTMYVPFVQTVQQDNVGSTKLVLEKLQELTDKVDRMKAGQAEAAPKLDIMNRAQIPGENAWVDESTLKSFFGSTLYSRPGSNQTPADFKQNVVF